MSVTPLSDYQIQLAYYYNEKVTRYGYVWISEYIESDINGEIYIFSMLSIQITILSWIFWNTSYSDIRQLSASW